MSTASANCDSLIAGYRSLAIPYINNFQPVPFYIFSFAIFRYEWFFSYFPDLNTLYYREFPEATNFQSVFFRWLSDYEIIAIVKPWKITARLKTNPTVRV